VSLAGWVVGRRLKSNQKGVANHNALFHFPSRRPADGSEQVLQKAAEKIE
jgi:hypothetical protein